MNAFDSNSSSIWTSSSNYAYSGNTTVYNGNEITLTSTGLALSGDWIQIKYPTAINVSWYQIQSLVASGSRSPLSWHLLGSANGINWTPIHSSSNSSSVWIAMDYPTLSASFPVSSSQFFSFYRLVVTSGRILVATGNWTCAQIYPSAATAVRANVRGHMECLSTDGANCVWVSTTAQCQSIVSSISASSVIPYSCESTVYARGTWCYIARTHLDSPRVSISEFNLNGTLC
jgi:hypothetical protein